MLGWLKVFLLELFHWIKDELTNSPSQNIAFFVENWLFSLAFIKQSFMFEKQNWEITNLMSFVVQMSQIPVLFSDLNSWPDSIFDNKQSSMALIVNIFIQKELVVRHGTCSLTKKPEQ